MDMERKTGTLSPGGDAGGFGSSVGSKKVDARRLTLLRHISGHGARW